MRTSREIRAKWRKMKLPTMAEKNAEKIWKTVAWATHDGDVPVMKARSFLTGGLRPGGGTGVPGV